MTFLTDLANLLVPVLFLAAIVGGIALMVLAFSATIVEACRYALDRRYRRGAPTRPYDWGQR